MRFLSRFMITEAGAQYKYMMCKLGHEADGSHGRIASSEWIAASVTGSVNCGLSLPGDET